MDGGGDVTWLGFKCMGGLDEGWEGVVSRVGIESLKVRPRLTSVSIVLLLEV